MQFRSFLALRQIAKYRDETCVSRIAETSAPANWPQLEGVIGTRNPSLRAQAQTFGIQQASLARSLLQPFHGLIISFLYGLRIPRLGACSLSQFPPKFHRQPFSNFYVDENLARRGRITVWHFPSMPVHSLHKQQIASELPRTVIEIPFRLRTGGRLSLAPDKVCCVIPNNLRDRRIARNSGQ